jgi:hypothetical protein
MRCVEISFQVCMVGLDVIGSHVVDVHFSFVMSCLVF